jgi:hypothetical protein
MRFQEITELFDNRASWHYTKIDKNQVEATFTIGENTHIVGFGIVDVSEEGDTWEVAFDTNRQFDMTGTGNAYTVFATVANVILDFVKRAKPYRIEFSAEKNEGSRVTVYRKMAKQLASKIGYNIEEEQRYISVYYVLTRK